MNKVVASPAASWWTSDTHFGHANIIKHSKRPYKDTAEMDEALIANWNSVVNPVDMVFHLGDVSFHKAQRTEEILNRLNGRIFLVQGNHDKHISKRFEGVFDMLMVKVDDPDATNGIQRIVCCHYALRVWEQSHYGSWNLFGHSHGSLPEIQTSKSFDVGVDCWGYTPVSYEQIKAKMATKVYAPVDHHTDYRAQHAGD